ncbi:MAG TPA: flagellar protein [Desulfotomaculum sp.]|nr:flagellar protein [Desulfotomaculum sp.]
MNVKISGFLPEAVPLTSSRPSGAAGRGQATPGASFQETLRREMAGEAVKLSAHAVRRLQERRITLNDADMQKIGRALHQAAAKGVKDSLIIYGDLTLVASVKNRTVVTALDAGDSAGRVFTNIDGAVVIK